MERGRRWHVHLPQATERWRESRALVPLYFYKGKYTTEPKPGANPIARVWRNPAAMLALDREAVEEPQR